MNQEPRGQERMAAAGTNGTGKSTFVERLFKDNGRDNIIVDPDGCEEIWWKYPELELQRVKDPENPKKTILKVPRFKGTVRIIFEKGLFEALFTYYKGEIQAGRIANIGSLVIDDARAMTGSRDEEIRRLMIRCRQFNIDFFFICHGLSEIPPSCFTFLTKLVLFRTEDSWERLKENIKKERHATFASYVAHVNQESRRNPHYKKILNLKAFQN